ncbi:hypothetical protein HDV01_006879 [Terramyces sp. JEL0728]|nr:hypothetical protein HDV01_006879 [Terramyces sp. JEL0728]
MKFDFDRQPIIDNHCHPFKTSPVTEIEIHGMFSESANINTHTIAHKRGVETLRKLKKDIFKDYNIKALLVDFGFSPCEYETMCKTFQILRLETTAQDVLKTIKPSTNALQEFNKLFMEKINPDIHDVPVVGYKSIAAYRCGFIQIQPDYAESEIKDSILKYINSGAARLQDPVIIKHILDLACSKGLPMQFHTGFGDADLDLVAANPVYLTLLIKKYPSVPIVLLHTSWPYCKEAGYLASVFSNVYLDTGLAIPLLSKQGQLDAIKGLMELGPLNKIMYSSDAHTRIEMFGVCVEQSRETFQECFKGYEEYLPMVYYQTAYDLYNLGKYM